MEVAIGNSSTPFQREVREWKRIDPSTGHLLQARIEADRWMSGPSNSYGKVSGEEKDWPINDRNVCLKEKALHLSFILVST